jgi:hypothetical protein
VEKEEPRSAVSSEAKARWERRDSRRLEVAALTIIPVSVTEIL